jgi:hypothetical protein
MTARAKGVVQMNTRNIIVIVVVVVIVIVALVLLGVI